MRSTGLFLAALLLAPTIAFAGDGTCPAESHCGFLCSLGHDVTGATKFVDGKVDAADDFVDKMLPSRWDIPLVNRIDRPQAATKPIQAGCGPAGSSVRVMTYNVKSLQWSGADPVANAIRAAAPDVVALQEVDDRTTRSGFKDETKELGRRTGLGNWIHLSAQPKHPGGQGTSLLSRFAIIQSRTWLLSWTSTPRALVCADVATPGGATTYCSVHLDLSGDTQHQEIREIETIFSGFHTNRIVLMGDFNAFPDSTTLKMIKRDGFRDTWDGPSAGTGAYSYPSWAPKAKIDFILTKGDVSGGCDHIVDTQASDHRPLVGVVH